MPIVIKVKAVVYALSPPVTDPHSLKIFHPTGDTDTSNNEKGAALRARVKTNSDGVQWDAPAGGVLTIAFPYGSPFANSQFTAPGPGQSVHSGPFLSPPPSGRFKYTISLDMQDGTVSRSEDPQLILDDLGTQLDLDDLDELDTEAADLADLADLAMTKASVRIGVEPVFISSPPDDPLDDCLKVYIKDGNKDADGNVDGKGHESGKALRQILYTKRGDDITWIPPAGYSLNVTFDAKSPFGGAPIAIAGDGSVNLKPAAGNPGRYKYTIALTNADGSWSAHEDPQLILDDGNVPELGDGDGN